MRDERGRIAERVASTEPFSIEFEYALSEEITGLRIGVYLSTSRGEPVLTSFDTDEPQAFERHLARPAGRYLSRCRIPANLLNEGLFVLGVNASSFRIRSYFTDEHALAFSIDGTGAPGSHWPETAQRAVAAGAGVGDRGGGVSEAGARARRSSAPWDASRSPAAPTRTCWRAGGPRRLGFALDRLQAALPGWLRAVEEAGAHVRSETPRRLLVIGALSWWIEYSAALGLLLSAAGHHVELATVPYRRWMAPAEAFDVDRQRAYLTQALAPLSRRIRLHDLSSGCAPFAAGGA